MAENTPNIGGLHAYRASQEINMVFQKTMGEELPFYALIFEAMRRADSINAARLRAAFPEVWDEMQARYNAPGGQLGSD